MRVPPRQLAERLARGSWFVRKLVSFSIAVTLMAFICTRRGHAGALEPCLPLLAGGLRSQAAALPAPADSGEAVTQGFAWVSALTHLPPRLLVTGCELLTD